MEFFAHIVNLDPAVGLVKKFFQPKSSPVGNKMGVDCTPEIMAQQITCTRYKAW